jgi:transcriptional regulator with XRE-family HTH domain
MREQALRTSLARALRHSREELGFTQRALASKAAVGEKYLSRIERGLATPSVLVALRLAQALGLGLDQLVAAARPERSTVAMAITRLLQGRSASELERAERVIAALFR